VTHDEEYITTPVPRLDSDPTQLTEEPCPECGAAAVVERSRPNGDVLSVRCSNEACARFDKAQRPWTSG
jgi:ssDNA-binding Zn-finger/Zn-ribbon topoisomerase 1